MFWKMKGKLLAKDGAVIDCDSCPCDDGWPCPKLPIPTISRSSLRPYWPYRYHLGSWYAEKGGILWGKGYVDDALEIVVNGETCFKDTHPIPGGGAHNIEDLDEVAHDFFKKLCRIPKRSTIDFYVWDEAYQRIECSVEFRLCERGEDDEEFE